MPMDKAKGQLRAITKNRSSVLYYEIASLETQWGLGRIKYCNYSIWSLKSHGMAVCIACPKDEAKDCLVVPLLWDNRGVVVCFTLSMYGISSV